MSALYTRDMLRLAVAVGDYPPITDADAGHAAQRAMPCGSRIAIDLTFAADRRIAAVGLAVNACAMGQASAALFARGAAGRTGAEIAAAHSALARWLTDRDVPAPDWPDIAILAPARDYPARHGAVLLPFAAGAAAARP